MSEKMNPREAAALFGTATVVDHYAEAAIKIGLWRSEELVLARVFATDQTLLEIGCGCGRISFGLWELGYQRVLGTDLSRAMITRARRLAATLEYAVPLRVADATKLEFEDGMFDGVIFGFNGLMQIPGRMNRRRALREMRRVVCPGGRLVFTTHDRAYGSPAGFWAAEKARWARGGQDSRLTELGDLVTEQDHGLIFIHIPLRDEVVEDLAQTGWILREDAMRSAISDESTDVKAFSRDCRFWVAENSA